MNTKRTVEQNAAQWRILEAWAKQKEWLMDYQSQMLITQHVDAAYQRGFQIGITVGMVCATIGCAVGVVIFTYVKG